MVPATTVVTNIPAPVLVFQLDFEIIKTIASFIKISSGHSIFIKFLRTICEIGGQMW
jgi:hypothetical protein